MQIIPAIDLREGKCVRLTEGKASEMIVYSDDPVLVARSFQEAGAKLIHVVDLDGAFSGSPQNLDIIKEIIANVDIEVELGGGIRTMKAIDESFKAGAGRVILGTVAIYKPELVKKACEKYGANIIVGIDSRDGMVAIEGWESVVEKTAVDLAHEMKAFGVTRIIYTDIRRDGTMKGPNLEAVAEMAVQSGLEVIASGGVSCLDDLKKLLAMEKMGISGVIMGKAFYTGAIDLKEAVALMKKVE